MRYHIYFFAIVIFITSCQSKSKQSKSANNQASVISIDAIKKIDVHAHFRYDREYLQSFFKKWNLQAILVDVAIEGDEEIERSWENYTELAKTHPDLFWLCSSLIGVNIDKPNFAENEIQRLTKEIDDGAKMVKVWKNFGMVTKDESGNFIQIDDERLQPIWDFLIKEKIPVIAHIAEPVQAWRPLDDPNNPHFGYYTNNPEYHAFKHPEIPSYETIISARDNWIANNPALQILCAHMGSMSHDVDMIAERLEKYPNINVEPAARFGDLAGQESKKVKAFFEKYQNRIFFGTDYGNRTDQKSLTPRRTKDEMALLDQNYNLLWRYLSSTDSLEIRNQKTEGLGLPIDILNKVYYQNVADFLDLD